MTSSTAQDQKKPSAFDVFTNYSLFLRFNRTTPSVVF